MKYTRFEELPVWQAAVELAERIYALTSKPEWKSHYSLRDQLERAAVSVSNNIAEGFERGTNQELINFLYIARGSAGEVRSMLSLLERIASFSNLKIKGQRFLTDKSRRSYKSAQDREEFLRELRETREAQAKE